MPVVANKCDKIAELANRGVSDANNGEVCATCATSENSTNGDSDNSTSYDSSDSDILYVSAANGTNIEKLRERIVKAVPESFFETTITGNLLNGGELVLLVMPQDIEASCNGASNNQTWWT